MMHKKENTVVTERSLSWEGKVGSKMNPVSHIK